MGGVCCFRASLNPALEFSDAALTYKYLVPIEIEIESWMIIQSISYDKIHV